MTTSSAPLAKLTEVSAPPTPKADLDELDLALLRVLSVDARQSQRALARAIEMSPPAVADRLARLERSGAIRGYRVDIDWAALGFPVVVYLAVTAGPGMDLSEIIRAIRAIPEAQDMSVVTGGLDLLVRLRVRDHAHLRQLLLSKIFQINGVQRPENVSSGQEGSQMESTSPHEFRSGPVNGVGQHGFVARHALYTEEQAAAAAAAARRIGELDLRTVRLIVVDQHGVPRGKSLSPEVR